MKKIISIVLACACALAFFGCGPKKPVLHVYMWSDYISPESVESFEKEFNCKVIIDTFDSNEMMYAKIKAGGSGYDLIQPSSYMAKIMNDQKMLLPLDKSKIPNQQYIDKDFLKNNALDKNMDYSMPYMVCYAVVAYDADKIKNLPDTWNVFSNPEFKKRSTVLNDIRELIGIALKVNGFSFNSTNEAELQKAKETILKWRENVAKFDNEGYKTGIATGEYVLVHGYSGDLAQVLLEKPNLKLMFPKEGLSISCDDWAIPADAKNADLAHAFMNYMAEPKIAVQNMEFSQYDAVNTEARKLMPEELRNAPAMNIPQEVLNKSEVIMDLGADNEKYNKIWDEIKM